MLKIIDRITWREKAQLPWSTCGQRVNCSQRDVNRDHHHSSSVKEIELFDGVTSAASGGISGYQRPVIVGQWSLIKWFDRLRCDLSLSVGRVRHCRWTAAMPHKSLKRLTIFCPWICPLLVVGSFKEPPQHGLEQWRLGASTTRLRDVLLPSSLCSFIR